MELVIATYNRGKFVELRDGLEVLGLQLLSLKDFPDTPEAPETGETFSEIARNKAHFYRDCLGLPVVAEDSGLVIPALNGFPGIFSARIGDSDEERIRIVLEKLRSDKNRSAYYHCSMVFLSGDQMLETEGRCEGFILESPRGNLGFGYDPIFCPSELANSLATRSFGEMALQEKATLSHRGRALEKMIPLIRKQHQ